MLEHEVRCRCCGEHKRRSEFPKRTRAVTGIDGECRKCKTGKVRVSRQERRTAAARKVETPSADAIRAQAAAEDERNRAIFERMRRDREEIAGV